MPHGARWTCPECDRRLGEVRGKALALEPGPRVLVAPWGGVIVECPDCRAERIWVLKLKKSA